MSNQMTEKLIGDGAEWTHTTAGGRTWGIRWFAQSGNVAASRIRPDGSMMRGEIRRGDPADNLDAARAEAARMRVEIDEDDNLRAPLKSASPRVTERLSATDPDAMPSYRQGLVLHDLDRRGKQTAVSLCVRADVLWRMEQRGWVSRSGPTGDRNREKWEINPVGVQALHRWKVAEGLIDE